MTYHRHLEDFTGHYSAGSDEPEQSKGKTVILLTILILLIVVSVGYHILKFFLPSLRQNVEGREDHINLEEANSEDTPYLPLPPTS
jgi:flagellar basal body-associated protein FliL